MSKYDQYIKSITAGMRKNYLHTTDKYVRKKCSLVEEHIKKDINWVDEPLISPNKTEFFTITFSEDW